MIEIDLADPTTIVIYLVFGFGLKLWSDWFKKQMDIEKEDEIQRRQEKLWLAAKDVGYVSLRIVSTVPWIALSVPFFSGAPLESLVPNGIFATPTGHAMQIVIGGGLLCQVFWPIDKLLEFISERSEGNTQKENQTKKQDKKNRRWFRAELDYIPKFIILIAMFITGIIGISDTICYFRSGDRFHGFLALSFSLFSIGFPVFSFTWLFLKFSKNDSPKTSP
jgi:hypothetical protein